MVELGNSIVKAHELYNSFLNRMIIKDEEFVWLRDVMGYTNLALATGWIRCTHNCAKDMLYCRIGVATLRHMAAMSHWCAEFARGELDRRGIPLDVNTMIVGLHAIDQCSTRHLNRWMNDGEGGFLAGVGFGTWLANEAQAAYDSGEKDTSGTRFVRNGMTFCIGANRDQLKLHTVI